jgi:pyruvate dehydrogenase E1 component beta subunit
MLNTPKRSLTFAEAICEALEQSMASDRRVIVIGEGVPDPKAIFGTTKGLRHKFGELRVFDMPLSENGLTGVCIGAALTGLRPVLVHQRVDFSLLSLDQLANNAAKWNYMFNGQSSVPLVVRVIVGRGWGQGPQHSQSLHGLFSQFPGLKVVLPTTAHDAKGMLIAAIRDPNPVIFIEHRWLHGITSEVSEDMFETPLDKARVVKSGKHVTLAAFSYMVLEALAAASCLEEELGISCEVIDMRSAAPLDIATVAASVVETGYLLAADISMAVGSVANSLIGKIVEQHFSSLKAAPKLVAMPDNPVPTSYYMTDGFYPSARTIVLSVIEMLQINPSENVHAVLDRRFPATKDHDKPNPNFKGPF